VKVDVDGKGDKPMSKLKNFSETENVEITVLVDNRADLMLKSTETVKRFTDKPLLAEHGFSALVDLKPAGVRILWDAGVTRIALLENAERMKIDLSTIDKIALSHGHHDHYAAMTDVVEKIAVRPSFREWDANSSVEEIEIWAKGRPVPLISHPHVFRERWKISERTGKKYGPLLVPREAWEAAGANLILSEVPFQLGPGCWTTGAVPRLSSESVGIPTNLAYRKGDEFIPDYLEDDQAIVINVRDKGLIVLSGCAHSGIVNTTNYAREISGVDNVWAIIGGYHLGRADAEDIQYAVDEIKKLKPEVVVPMHCTGFEAIKEFAAQMPEAFVVGSVGMKCLF